MMFLAKSITELAVQLPAIRSLTRVVLRRLPVDLSPTTLKSPDQTDIVLSISFSPAQDPVAPSSSEDEEHCCCSPWCGLTGYDSA
jgi:hypothetical protein